MASPQGIRCLKSLGQSAFCLLPLRAAASSHVHTPLRVCRRGEALLRRLQRLAAGDRLCLDKSIVHVTSRLAAQAECMTPAQLLAAAQWSARTGLIDPEFHMALLGAAKANSSHFHAAELADFVWALAAVAVSDAGMSETIIPVALKEHRSWGLQRACNVIWALAFTGHYDLQLLKDIFERDCSTATEREKEYLKQVLAMLRLTQPRVAEQLNPDVEYLSFKKSLQDADFIGTSLQAVCEILGFTCKPDRALPMEWQAPGSVFAELQSGQYFCFCILGGTYLVRDVRHGQFLKSGFWQLHERCASLFGWALVAVPDYDLQSLRCSVQRQLYIEACLRVVGRSQHRSPKPPPILPMPHHNTNSKLNEFAHKWHQGVRSLSKYELSGGSQGQAIPIKSELERLSLTLCKLLQSSDRAFMEPWALSSVIWACGCLTKSTTHIIGATELLNACAIEVLRRLRRWRHAGPPFLPFEGRQACNIVWAFAVLHQQHHALINAALPILLTSSSSLTSQELGNAIWAFAKMRRDDSVLFREVSKELAKRRMSSSTVRDMINIAWGFAVTGISSYQFLVSLPGKAMLWLPRLTSQDIANLAHALAKSGMHNDSFLTVVVNSHEHIVRKMDARELCMLLWAITRCALSHDDFYDAYRAGPTDAFPACLPFLQMPFFGFVAQHFLHGDSGGLDSQLAVSVAWSFATLSICHMDLFEHLAACCMRQGALAQMPPQQIANISWAFAVVSVTHMSLFEAVASVARKEHVAWDISHACNVALSLVVVGQYDVALLEAVLSQGDSRLSALQADQLRQIGMGYCLEHHLATQLDSKPITCDHFEQQTRCMSWAHQVWKLPRPAETRSSELHLHISAMLAEIGVPHVNEHRILHHFDVDIWVLGSALVIEVDGPAHFVFPVSDMQDGMPCSPWLNGRTQLKRRLLRHAGYRAISIKYSDFTAMSNPDFKRYLVMCLQAQGWKQENWNAELLRE